MLVIVCKLAGGLLIGFAPSVASAEGAEHHCETMAMEHEVMEHGSGAGHHDPISHSGHESRCSDGCQCGCTHAPGTLFVPLIGGFCASHPPEAHTAELLTVQARPDSVFKPPI